MIPKYRAWIKKEKKMLPVVCLDWERNFVYCFIDEIEEKPGEHIQTKGTIQYRLEDVELMQFTGRLDKNEKEIYAGDLLQALPDGHEPRAILEVFWDDEMDGFQLRSKNYQTPLSSDYKIIGNVYENPKLLKEVKT